MIQNWFIVTLSVCKQGMAMGTPYLTHDKIYMLIKETDKNMHIFIPAETCSFEFITVTTTHQKIYRKTELKNQGIVR